MNLEVCLFSEDYEVLFIGDIKDDKLNELVKNKTFNLSTVEGALYIYLTGDKNDKKLEK